MFFELFQPEFELLVVSAVAPLTLLFLRIILAVMFIDSGRLHLTDPAGRGKGLGLPPVLITIIGIANVAGGTLVLLGWFTHVGALILFGVMIGAIYLKMFVWKTGIYGENNNGWYYDALLLAGTGILFAFGGGLISIDALI